MKKILNLQELENSKWPAIFSDIYKDNLVSVFVFGNCLEENFNALESLWTLGIILKNVNFDEIKKLAPLQKKLILENICITHIWQSSEILSTLEKFPLEYLEITCRNKTLVGIPPLQGFTPNVQSLKEQCLREWMGYLFRKRLFLLKKNAQKDVSKNVKLFFEDIGIILNGIYFIAFNHYPNSLSEVCKNFVELSEFYPQERISNFEKFLEKINLFVKNWTNS